jgi:Alpha/beta hydrolase domain
MASSSIPLRRLVLAVMGAALLVGLIPAGATGEPLAVANPTIEGPIPGSVPGDRLSPVLEDTYPFFSTWYDLASAGYVEQEFYISGNADAYSTTGALFGSDIPTSRGSSCAGRSTPRGSTARFSSSGRT